MNEMSNTSHTNCKRFATAINCMDGRVQSPVTEWLKTWYGVDYVDMITEPGPERVLTEYREQAAIEAVCRKLNISITAHNSSLVAIVGHHDCAGNPAGNVVQHKQIIDAANMLKSRCTGVKVIGLWVNENWEVREIG